MRDGRAVAVTEHLCVPQADRRAGASACPSRSWPKPITRWHAHTMTNEVLSSYPAATGRAIAKEIDHIDRHVRRFLALCPFVVIGATGADGKPDLSPRGGNPGFVFESGEER